MKRTFKEKAILIILIAICFSLIVIPSALASYSIGFTTNEIQIMNPPSSGLEVHGKLPISVTAKIDKVWFCVRGPGEEVEVQSAEVVDGEFSIDIPLRFGPGKYTIWAGNNKTSFDGKIRFTTNNIVDDNRYVSSSLYVDCENPEIIKLSNGLASENMTELEKARAFHDWVAGNIEYDYQAFSDGDLGLTKASKILENKKGVCSGYSFLYAALCRAAGLEAKVVYGQVNAGNGWVAQQHAWNEVKVDGKWITVDNTWDSGYIKDGSFVADLNDEYFNCSPATLARTHSGAEDKLY